jgi:polysaccharide pyruvyl transferase WcaK-like protein/SAM-dependent methyltransferase
MGGTGRAAVRAAPRKSAGLRVGLFGLLGQGNLGNDGSMEAVLAYLREAYPDMVLDALCSGPALVSERYALRAAPLGRFDTNTSHEVGLGGMVRRCLELGAETVVDTFRIATWVRRHDSVIVPGMGVLEQTVPLRPWQTPYLMFVLSMSGKILGTKVALVSVGANVMHDRLTRRLFITAARLAHYRSFRDTVSRDAIREMGLDVSGDAVYPDVVFALRTEQYEQDPPAVVGVGIMDYSGTNEDRRQGDEIRSAYVAKMTRFVTWLVENGRQVRVFTSDSVDEPIAAQIVADIKAQYPELPPFQVVTEPVPSTAELLRQTASVGTVVATRFHNVLYSLRLGRPTVAIGYAAKHQALMTQMGMSRYCQEARSLDVARLIEQFTELESRAAELRLIIAERNAALAQEVDNQFRELSAVLFPAAQSRATSPARIPGPERTRVPRTGCREKETKMSDAREGVVPRDGAENGVQYYGQSFWRDENLKFSQPHYRMEKAVRIIKNVAGGRECDLLDIGCGPAALMHLLPPTIHYYGIDMAIQHPAPNLVEADIIRTPIEFAGKKFDIIVAQGLFEYVPEVQSQKFSEIAQILRPGGTFIVTYWNYTHRNTTVYHAHSNVQLFGDFRRDLERHFRVDRFFPASHNWFHGSPSMRFNKALNMRINMNIPVISPLLGVEYFVLCSPRCS